MEEQKSFTLERDGFIGKLYLPKVPAFPSKACISCMRCVSICPHAQGK